MKIDNLILIILTLELAACASALDFPKEVKGRYQPINSQEIKDNVK